MPLKRRTLCAMSVTLALGLASAFSLASAANAAEIKVTLLGSGTPTPRLSAFSASTLVEAGSERLIFDFGRGSTIRLFQKKIPIGSITAHFITHLHSDHVVRLPDMWLTGWIGTPWGSRKTPMLIYGPTGTVAMTENLTKASGSASMTRITRRRASPSTRTTSGRVLSTTATASRSARSKSITARRSSRRSVT
ncbi:MAG TPA: MBL fold metallo-hydrolase [Bradyrhizobium sp.]